MKRLLVMGMLVVAACRAEQPEKAVQSDKALEAEKVVDPKGYEAEIKKWQADRATGLTRETGWLTLVGLHWLNEGRNTFGSDASNKVVLKANVPAKMGTVTLSGGAVTLEPDRAAGLKINGQPAPPRLTLLPDADPNGPTVVEVGSVQFQVIKRSDRYALRVRDRESAARKEFRGLTYFPIDPKWRLEARFEPYNPPKKIPITNVIGMTSEETAPGALVFTIDGREYRLDPILEQGEADLFVIFRDATAGKETYGAARYLYVKPAGADGKTVIDFNKAYNPPCAFTPYATCPLPPAQNKLPIRITAGELKYEGGH